MSNTLSTIDEDFEAIEAAVMESARGRWFLSEYLRRHQARETMALLDSIRKLERVMEAEKRGETVRGSRLDAIIMGEMNGAAREISGMDAFAPAALPEAVEEMARDASRLAGMIGEAEVNERDANRMTMAAAELRVMSDKLKVVSRTLGAIATACGENTPATSDEPQVSESGGTWFGDAQDLFEDGTATGGETGNESAEKPAAQADEAMQAGEGQDGGGARLTIRPRPAEEHSASMPADEEPAPAEPAYAGPAPAEPAKKARPRIIITRKPSSRDMDIPFAGKPQDGDEPSGKAAAQPAGKDESHAPEKSGDEAPAEELSCS